MFDQKRNPMRITESQLRRIIRQEVRALREASGVSGGASEIAAVVGDAIDTRYEDILDAFMQNPDLADQVLALARQGGLREAMAYSTEQDLTQLGMASIAGATAGSVVNELMAIIGDPNLIPWTQLRALQLNDRLVMDGSAFKSMAIGAAIGALASIAVSAKRRFDQSRRGDRRSIPVRRR